MRKVLVAWSGGLDSTALVEEYVEKGWAVDAVYMDFQDNPSKVLREKAAVQKMGMEYFNKKFPGQVSRHEIASFVYRGIGNVGHMTVVAEPPIWLLNLFLTANPKEHEEVALGWVQHDTALSFLPEYERIWKAYADLHPKTLPPLVFPLRKKNKRHLWERMNESLRQSVTWCRRTDNVPEPCGKCEPCRRMSLATGIQYGVDKL